MRLHFPNVQIFIAATHSMHIHTHICIRSHTHTEQLLQQLFWLFGAKNSNKRKQNATLCHNKALKAGAKALSFSLFESLTAASNVGHTLRLSDFYYMLLSLADLGSVVHETRAKRHVCRPCVASELAA